MNGYLIFFLTWVSVLAAPVKHQNQAAPRSSSSVECFRRVKHETGLSDGQAIRLCRCARSTRPVDCYNQARFETGLNDDEILDLCIGRRYFYLDCED